MLRHRLILGAIFIAALVGVFWLDARLDAVRLDGPWRDLIFGRDALPAGLALFGAAIIVASIAAWELTGILRNSGIRATGWLTILAAIVGLVVIYGVTLIEPTDITVALFGSAAVAVLLLALVCYSHGHTVEGVPAAAGGTLFAMIYLGVMLGFLLAIRQWESAWVVLAVILVTKSCDIGAYTTGRLIGRRKLIPWLSPGKTWEGLIGGIVFSALIASLLTWWGRGIDPVDVRPGLEYVYHYPPLFAAFAGALLGLVGQGGDLIASLLKRSAGIKDSSNLLPGFGGVLDLLDSILLVGPVAYWLLWMMRM